MGTDIDDFVQIGLDKSQEDAVPTRRIDDEVAGGTLETAKLEASEPGLLLKQLQAVDGLLTTVGRKFFEASHETRADRDPDTHAASIFRR